MQNLIIVLVYLSTLFVQSGPNVQEPLYEKTLERPFSHPDDNDVFSIRIVGDSISTGEFILTITTFENEVIFQEKHHTNLLIGYGLPFEETDTNIIETYIKKRVDEFFIDDNFLNPAIPENHKFDPDYSDEEIWNDIKSDSTAIGFYYLLGIENGCRIAYSKKKREVVKYFCCC